MKLLHKFLIAFIPLSTLFLLLSSALVAEWIVFPNCEDSDTFSHYYDKIRWSGMVMALISLLGALFGWLQIRRFSERVQELYRHARRFRQGDFNGHIRAATKGEIGELGAVLDEMAESLERLVAWEVKASVQLTHSRNLQLLETGYSTIIHEIGNYFNVVTMAVTALKAEDLSHGGSRLMEQVEHETDRISVFIKNFMQFIKDPHIRPVKTTLEGLVRDVLFVYEETARQMGIQVSCEWDSSLPAVETDLHLLHQMLNNLVKNAMEAMGKRKGRIVVGARVEGSHFKLYVSDTGPGIPEEIHSRIFDPFFSTKRNGGAGLGLPLCRTIMEAHKGAIECCSEPGKGATFTLAFPLESPGGQD